MPLRLAALCGLLAGVVFVVGLVLGDVAQPDAFSPADDNISDIGRLGALVLAVVGVGRFLEGFLRLDCRGIDAGCENTSWQADAHGVESGIVAAAFFIAPPLLALAFSRLPEWRGAWLPTLLAVPVVIATSVLFSILGDGAATRAASIVWFVWLGFAALWLLRVAERRTVGPPP